MAYPPRKIAFVLASTDHGALIVNRFDYHMVNATAGFGVGYFRQDELTAVHASYGYEWFTLGLNFLAVHPSDPTRQAINVTQPGAGTGSHA
jgi:hypothetical protein